MVHLLGLHQDFKCFVSKEKYSFRSFCRKFYARSKRIKKKKKKKKKSINTTFGDFSSSMQREKEGNSLYISSLKVLLPSAVKITSYHFILYIIIVSVVVIVIIKYSFIQVSKLNLKSHKVNL